MCRAIWKSMPIRNSFFVSFSISSAMRGKHLNPAIPIDPKRITISAARHDQRVDIEIADNGPGIPSAVRDRLFQPFAGTMRQGGSGLGLAISRELIAAHGGVLELVSTNGAGDPLPDHCARPGPAFGQPGGPLTNRFTGSGDKPNCRKRAADPVFGSQNGEHEQICNNARG